MKKLFLSLTLLGTFLSLAPTAEAGNYRRSVRYSDSCNYPAYRSGYYRGYSDRYYYAPRRVRYVRSYDDCYYPRYYRSAPRFSFRFGF